MNDQLKPCPFCGEKEDITINHQDYGEDSEHTLEMFSVTCPRCTKTINLQSGSIEDAINEWNCRDDVGYSPQIVNLLLQECEILRVKIQYLQKAHADILRLSQNTVGNINRYECSEGEMKRDMQGRYVLFTDHYFAISFFKSVEK